MGVKKIESIQMRITATDLIALRRIARHGVELSGASDRAAKIGIIEKDSKRVEMMLSRNRLLDGQTRQSSPAKG